MIVFPLDYIKTQYPGYFWNVQTQKLYSIKSGKLKELKMNSGTFPVYPSHPTGIGPHYQISVEGWKQYIMLDKLKQLSNPLHTEIVDIA